MADKEYRPRLSAELTQQQADIFFNILPHGWQKPICQAIVNGVIKCYEEGGMEAIGAIVSEYISIQQLARIGSFKTIQFEIQTLEARIEELKKRSKARRCI
jgi:hypothetical protein